MAHLRKIEEIYQAVVDRPVDERRAFLDDSCGDDKELRHEVESLLRYDGLASNFLDSTPAGLVAEMFSQGDKSLQAGDTIGRYKITRLLGEGGMGKVYLAEDPRLNRHVALKVLPHGIAADSERLRRFEREAQAASALNHPNIITVHEFGEDGGVHFLVSEFVDGRTLREKLSSGALEMSEGLEIAIQIASALSAAHDAGISHRDIKPENIMIRADGYVKVLDFGLAKQHRSELRSSDSGSEDPTRQLFNTEPGTVMGTDVYMSPEQARGRKVDARSDIWSLGVVCYEMLAGRRPFSGDTRADVMVSVLTSQPTPLSSHRPAVPAELDWMIAKALAKDVEGRYQTAKEFRVDLKRAKKQIELHESTDATPSGSISDEKGRSTIETGIKTFDEIPEGTDGGNVIPSERKYFWSSAFGSSTAEARSYKLPVAIAAVLLFAIGSWGVYSLFIADRSDRIDSIAVLPFENPSGNPDLTYLSDGLSENLIDRLSQLPQLKVISRNSSFKFRGPDLDLKQVASQLGVRAIATGRVMKVGDDLSIRVDIVDVVDDKQLAGGQYTRRSGDVANIQNEIAQLATAKLRLPLTEAQSTRLMNNDTENAEAFRFYLSGLVALNGPTQNQGSAIDFFQQAVKLDPDYAEAHAEIAWIHIANAFGSKDPDIELPKAKTAIEMALTLDPNLSKAHALRALIKETEFDWRGAEDEYRRAIELSPNLDFARNHYSFYLSTTGKHDEALRQLEELRMRDPINKRLGLLQKAIVLVQARRFDEALSVYQEAQAVEPSNEVPKFAIGYAFAGKGSYNEAVANYREAVTELGGEGKYSQPLVYLAAAYAKVPGKQTDARALLARIEAMHEYRSPALIAIVYAELGDKDKAMELLERAYVDRDLLLRYIGQAYEYDGLRDDPRFQDLLRRMNLSR